MANIKRHAEKCYCMWLALHINKNFLTLYVFKKQKKRYSYQFKVMYNHYNTIFLNTINSTCTYQTQQDWCNFMKNKSASNLTFCAKTAQKTLRITGQNRYFMRQQTSSR